MLLVEICQSTTPRQGCCRGAALFNGLATRPKCPLRVSPQRRERVDGAVRLCERTPPERTDVKALPLVMRAFWAGAVGGRLGTPVFVCAPRFLNKLQRREFHGGSLCFFGLCGTVLGPGFMRRFLAGAKDGLRRYAFPLGCSCQKTIDSQIRKSGASIGTPVVSVCSERILRISLRVASFASKSCLIMRK